MSCPKLMRREALEVSDKLVDSHSRCARDKQMHVVRPNSQRENFNAKSLGLGVQKLVKAVSHLRFKDWTTELGAPYQMVLQRMYAASRFSFVFHTVNILIDLFSVIYLFFFSQGTTTPGELRPRQEVNSYPPVS